MVTCNGIEQAYPGILFLMTRKTVKTLGFLVAMSITLQNDSFIFSQTDKVIQRSVD